LNDLLEKILKEQSEEIATEWSGRIEHLLPKEAAGHSPKVAELLLSALQAYFIDEDIESVVHPVEKIAREYLSPGVDTTRILINALLIGRYILLAVMARHSAQPINSLEVFGHLNDAFEPLIRAINTKLKARSEEILHTLPTDFTRASQLGMLTVDFAGIGIFMLDKDINFIYWSNGMARLYDLPEKEVLGQNFIARFPAFKKEKILLKALKKALTRGDESELLAVRHASLHRGERIINFKVAPLRNQQGQIIGASTLVHDITEQQQSKLALRKYEQYFANILNDAADAIMILDEQDKIVMWNKAAEALYGWSKEKVLGKSVTVIVPSDSKSLQEIQWISRQVREKGFIRNYRTQRTTVTGKQVIIDITRTAIRNEKGEYVGSSVISRDITHQEQLRDQLIHSEKLSAVGTLAAGIAHEIGSPLTAISSITQLLKAKSTDSYFIERISLIQHSIDRIARTVRTLVDFSKPIAQKIERIYLNSVIEQVVHIVKYDRRLKYHQVVTEMQPDVPQIKASFDQLLQVFINLSLNAADAMERKKDGRLLIKTWSNEDFVLASVSDNGSGISADHLPHIFEPFFSTKEPGKGTGLGLWVSYNIIKAFSGKIEVESKPGEGTIFTIAIPIDRNN
jgi:PAS domain S-box-containing protein